MQYQALARCVALVTGCAVWQKPKHLATALAFASSVAVAEPRRDSGFSSEEQAPVDGEEQVGEFVKKWPKLVRTLAKKNLRQLIRTSEQGGLHFSASPDQRSLVVVRSADAPDAGMLILDGPAGETWRVELPSVFPAPPWNTFEWEWSRDGRRLYFATSTGHGDRLALLDARKHRVLGAGFSNGRSWSSPALQHVVWMPVECGRSAGDSGDVRGDQIWIDDGVREAWGNTDEGDPKNVEKLIGDLEWLSEDRFRFCGRHDGKYSRYLGVIAPAHVSVTATGSACSVMDVRRDY